MTDLQGCGDGAAAATAGPTQASRLRAADFFVSRWRELVSPDSDIGRRSKTLNARTAAEEAAKLAESAIRAGGVTRPGEDPALAGHGIASLPDVVKEALTILSTDVVLKAKQPQMVSHLADRLARLDKPDARQEEAKEVLAMCDALLNTYTRDALSLAQDIIAARPRELFELEDLVESLVADLRTRGWNDASLLEQLERALARSDGDRELVVEKLLVLLTAAPRKVTVYVKVRTADLPFDKAGLTVSTNLPERPGAYVSVECESLDPHFSAPAARSRIASLLGAAEIFTDHEGLLDEKSDLVVRDGEVWINVEPAERLRKERRNSKRSQIEKIMASVWEASAYEEPDPVFDAIRHHQRAVSTADQESRFLLLYLGIERLVAGAADYANRSGRAARHLVPKVISLAKLRRELAALCRALDRIKLLPAHREQMMALVGGKHPFTAEPLIDTEKVLGLLLGEESESRKLTAFFYTTHVHETQWYCRLRRRLRGSSGQDVGAHVAEYIEASRQRVEWQMLRLYRARNGVAHAAHRPAWIRDLIRHAHFYLTNLVAVAVNYREHSPTRSPVDIFTTRCGQYDSFVSLLRAGYAHVLQPQVLLRPTALFGP